MTEPDIVRQYREYRRISGEIQSGVLELVPHVALVQLGRRLGAVWQGELALDNAGDLKLLHDLAIHAGRNGRSRAIDRYARKVRFPLDSAHARMMHGLRTACFTLFYVLDRHDVAGVVARDVVRQRDFHFMDVAIGLSAQPKDAFVGRLMEIDGYSMSCISVLPLVRDLADAALTRMPARSSSDDLAEFQDPRCAIALYRSAIELGLTQRCVTLDIVNELPTEDTIKSILAFNDRPPVDLPALLDAR